MRLKWLKIHFLRDILEAKLGDNGEMPSAQQNIISIDVIIGVEMHIDQYFTCYNHQKRSEMAKIPKNPPILAHFSLIEKSKSQKCG